MLVDDDASIASTASGETANHMASELSVANILTQNVAFSTPQVSSPFNPQCRNSTSAVVGVPLSNSFDIVFISLSLGIF
jgi:hypothetical protein